MVTSSSPSSPLYRLPLGLLYCTTLLHFGDCCGLILVSWAFFFGLDPNCRDGTGQLLSRTRHLVWSKDRLAPCLKSKKPPRPFTDNVVFIYLFISCSFFFVLNHNGNFFTFFLHLLH